MLVNQPNSGVSATRNNGLRYAKGDYIWFVDSDDAVSINSLYSIISFLYITKVDFIRIEKTSVPEEYIPRPELAPTLVQTKQWLGPATAVNFIVKKEYLLTHNILFEPEISYGEDTMWVFWLGYYPNSHTFFENKLYNYRQRKSSAMGCVNRTKHLKSMLRMADIYIQAYNKEGGNNAQLLSRARESAQNALFDAIRIGYAKSKETLQQLIEYGIYPYPPLWERISTKYGINNLIINCFSLLFACKYYYLIVSYIINFRNRK